MIDADPAGNWVAVGETDGGVTVTLGETVDVHRTDQRTGPVKATRSEESLILETNIAEVTLETLADLLGVTAVDTAEGVGTAGFVTLPLYRGLVVDQMALLFRGPSAYGDFDGQFYVPRGYPMGEVGMEFTKDSKTLVPWGFEALEDMGAATVDERFGVLTMMDAEGT